MRFQAAHKLVTYLLVLSALAALATTRALSASSAALFLALAAGSYLVDAGGKAALAIDRWARLVRGATGALLAVIVWRIWRRMPDADPAPAFDLILALLAYKLLFRRSHRDYVQIYALTFLLVLVASTVTATFLFVAAFAVYVVLATWALILFHLRREMEENYLVRHSAQAPSQKVGIGRILSSRRVVGRAFFGATFVVAAGVFLGALAVFALVPRLGAGFVLGGRAPTAVLGLTDEVAIGRFGTAATSRSDVVLRAMLPRIADLNDAKAQSAAAEQLYFRGAVYDTYENGRWIRSRRPELRTLVTEVGRRAYVGEPGETVTPTDGALAGAERQEIEAVGIPATALLAVDRAVAIELPAGRLGAGGPVRVAPRWSGETALRIGGESADALVTLAHAHYTAYSRPGAQGPPALEVPARLANLQVPDELRDVKVLGNRLGAAGDATADVTRRSRRSPGGCARGTATPPRRPRRRRAPTRSRTSCSPPVRGTASTSRPRRCCCCARPGCRLDTSPAFAGANGTRWAGTWPCAPIALTPGRRRSCRAPAGRVWTPLPRAGGASARTSGPDRRRAGLLLEPLGGWVRPGPPAGAGPEGVARRLGDRNARARPVASGVAGCGDGDGAAGGDWLGRRPGLAPAGAALGALAQIGAGHAAFERRRPARAAVSPDDRAPPAARVGPPGERDPSRIRGSVGNRRSVHGQRGDRRRRPGGLRRADRALRGGALRCAHGRRPVRRGADPGGRRSAVPGAARVKGGRAVAKMAEWPRPPRQTGTLLPAAPHPRRPERGILLAFPAGPRRQSHPWPIENCSGSR